MNPSSENISGIVKLACVEAFNRKGEVTAAELLRAIASSIENIEAGDFASSVDGVGSVDQRDDFTRFVLGKSA